MTMKVKKIRPLNRFENFIKKSWKSKLKHDFELNFHTKIFLKGIFKMFFFYYFYRSASVAQFNRFGWIASRVQHRNRSRLLDALVALQAAIRVRTKAHKILFLFLSIFCLTIFLPAIQINLQILILKLMFDHFKILYFWTEILRKF